jgi:hypothetical protein
MSDGVPPVFAALFRAIHEGNEADKAHRNEIEEDIEAEGETLLDNSGQEDDNSPAPFDISQLQEFLLDASKGVTGETDKEYKRYA